MNLLCVSVCVLALPLQAQESAFEDIESRSRKDSIQEFLDIRDVRESSAKDAGEALTRVEGLWKLRKGGIANDVVLRGFQRDNINVLIDGARVHGACPNGMDPAAFHVDFAEIQEVQITKGPYDVRNGGGPGGSVYVVNKRADPGFRVTPNFAAGSFGFFNPSLTGAYADENVHVSAGESFRRSRPYSDGHGLLFTEKANYRDTAAALNAFGVNTAWGRLGYAIRPNQRLEFTYTRQNADEILYPYLLMDALYDNATRAGVSYGIDGLGAIEHLRASGYYNTVAHWMTDERRSSSAGLPRPYSMATKAASKALGARVEAEFENLTAGFEIYGRTHDAVNTMRMGGSYLDQHAIPNAGVTGEAGYGEFRHSVGGRALLSAGARIEHSTSAVRDRTVPAGLFWAFKGTRSLEAADTVPSGNLRITYSLPKGLDVFAGAASGARVPSPQERYFMLRRSGSDWVGNPALRPVRNAEWDLGLVYRNRRVYLRATVFQSHLSNYVTVHNQPRRYELPGISNVMARSYANVTARIDGGELTYRFGITERLLLSGGLSGSRGRKNPRPEELIFDRDLSEMPPLKSRLALRYGARRFFAEIEGLGSRAQQHVDSDLREQPTSGYGVMNAKCGIHTNRLRVTLGIDNVTNRFYYEAYSYQRDPFRSGTKVPEPGRALFASAVWEF